MLAYWSVVLYHFEMSYHGRQNVERDSTLHRQREVIQINGSICYCNVPFIICLFNNFSNSLNLNTADFHRNLLSILKIILV